MVRKYVYGEPFETEAVVRMMEAERGPEELGIGQVSLRDGFLFSYEMAENDVVYGLGEANRGLNKRGYCYISNCTDEPNHTEDKRSLYGAHNFIVVSGATTWKH